jgi:hypothetical protein
MRIKVSQPLARINEAAGVINAAQFTWQVISGVIHWFHKGKPHHTIELNDEQRRHHSNGGAFECEYGCGTTLRTGPG